MAAKLSALLMICSLLAITRTSPPRSGPYDILIEKLDECPDFGVGESFFPTRLTKVNRKAMFNGTFRLSEPLDDNSKLTVELQGWGNQGYRPRTFVHSLKTCNKFMQEGHTLMKAVFGSTGYNVTGCPIPAGDYTMRGLVLDKLLMYPRIKTMVYNRYRAVLNLFYSNRRLGCVRFYGEIAPKEG